MISSCLFLLEWSHLTVRYGFRASHEAFDLSALNGPGTWDLAAGWAQPDRCCPSCRWQGAHQERLVSSATRAGRIGIATNWGHFPFGTLGSHRGFRAGDLC